MEKSELESLHTSTCTFFDMIVKNADYSDRILKKEKIMDFFCSYVVGLLKMERPEIMGYQNRQIEY